MITGTGRAFSAGYDIGMIPDQTFEREAEALVAHRFHVMEAVGAHRLRCWRHRGGMSRRWARAPSCAATSASWPAGAQLGMPPAKLGLIYGHTGLRHFYRC